MLGLVQKVNDEIYLWLIFQEENQQQGKIIHCESSKNVFFGLSLAVATNLLLQNAFCC